MPASCPRAILLLLVGMALLSACGDDSGESDTLTVFAAASLTASFGEIGEAFEAEHEGVTVEFNFAGSQALATQLIEGANADVFASANLTQMTRAVDEERTADEPVIFARNQLAIIVPADNPAGVESVNDLGDPDLKLVLAAEDVPAGQYARETLGMLAETAAFQERHPDFSVFSIVSNETNVLQVVTRVSLGEADAGIVYETDVSPDVAENVTLIPIPDDLNVIAEYPIAVLEGGNEDLAENFVDFVLSGKGQMILADRGFRAGDGR